MIEIPKGNYSPVFLPRASESPLPSVATDNERTKGVPRGWLVPLLAGVLTIAIGVIVWQTVSSPFRRQRDVFLAALHQSTSPSANFSIYKDLLGPLGANPGRDALLVLSNPRIITYFVSKSQADSSENSDVSISVPKELRNTLAPALKASDRDLPYLFFHVTRENYTGIGEAVAAFHVGRLMDLLGRQVHLTQGRFLNWDHVEKQDLILLGGPRSNDWSYEKDAKPNFVVGADSIMNAKPLPGEQPVYRSDRNVDYALIQKLKTPYDFETVLLAGLTSAGTAAAGEFLANPNKMHPVYKALRASAPGQNFPTDWEVLISVAVRDALPLETSVVAIRPGPAARSK